MNYQKSVLWSAILTDRIGITANNGDTLSYGEPVFNCYRENDTNYFNINGKLLINNEQKLEPTDWTLIENTYGCFYKKMGDIVTIRATTTENKTLPGWGQILIATVGQSIRPTKTLRFSVYSRGSSTVYGQLETNGQLILFNWDAQKSFEAGTLSFVITYLL